MKKRLLEILIIAVALIPVSIFSQGNNKIKLTGKVTYQTTQNVYVSFENTNGISAGDTLYLESARKLIPAVIVKFISSISCAGEKITNVSLNDKDKIIAFVNAESQNLKNSNIENDTTFLADTLMKRGSNTENFKQEEKKRKINYAQRTTGRFSIQSYSNLTNISNGLNYQRWRYTLMFRAPDINNSGFSVSTYSTFNYRADQWNYISSNLGQAIRIYDLTFGYRFDPTARIWVGRYLNPKISSLSSVDGIQFEKYFGSVYTGAVIGSRPDFIDMGMNSKLFETGAYIGKTDTLGYGSMENTFSIFQQTNNFITDRRFIYLQHTDNIFENTYIFASSEIDLYKKENNTAKNDFTLTSLYLTARYVPIRQVSFYLSYDARKNIIYYETFKSFIDSVIDRETRQGVRGRVNFHPFNRLNLAVEGGYRYKKGDVKPSRNFTAYISYTGIPIIDISSSLTYTKLYTGYMEGDIAGIYLSKDLFNSFVNVSLGLRNINYKFSFDNFVVSQKSVESDLSLNVSRYFYLTLSYEGEFEHQNSYNRIFFGVTTRF